MSTCRGEVVSWRVGESRAGLSIRVHVSEIDQLVRIDLFLYIYGDGLVFANCHVIKA